VLRLRKRGVYDRKTIYKVLDEAIIAHVGFTVAGDPTSGGGEHPCVLPMLFGYEAFVDTDEFEDVVYLHGSISNAMLRSMVKANQKNAAATTSTDAKPCAPDATPVVCITVTLLDGLVLARSTFNSSCNYRRCDTEARLLALSGTLTVFVCLEQSKQSPRKRRSCARWH
jgi:nitroimidazol reductase NimA-like FMN-containing flavoprotein (pyridoxamine 5'-phosphate oxidase superfamily)